MEEEKKKKKTISEVPSHIIMDRTRHGQHWLTALPTPYTESLRDRYSLHLGILHKLVRICRWAIHAYTYRQREHSR